MIGNTAGATPGSAPLHIIAHGPHGLSQQSIQKSQYIRTANTESIYVVNRNILHNVYDGDYSHKS